MVTLRNPDLDKEGRERRRKRRWKSFYLKKVGSHLKVGVVTTDFEKVPLAARCPQAVEGQGLESGRHTGSLSESRGCDPCCCVLTAGRR